MRKLFFILLSLSLLSNYSCDDGDIITVELEFEDTFEACGESDLVLYKTKEDPSESLSVLITNYSLEDILEVGADNTFNEEKSATFYYRTYNDASLPNDLFCSEIPPNVNIVSDDNSACTAEINTILVEDDNDGILAQLEDINGNGDLEDDDTDGDGLPNYIDADDDGDNILTASENPDPNGDGDLSDAQDTDGDNIPDYLDNDDDGDGVLTRDEENDSQNNNPGNDITDSDVGADYLNPEVNTTVPATAYREHTIIRSYVVTITLFNIDDLGSISYDEYDFGILKDSEIPSTYKSRKITPDFN
ncbi:hypothetical protein MBM09_07555 [Flaviramulus sp. BrNp1-15]|uniref:hypothetical protein n=1 Tax=Flaviramulus sp. BrNp1-15 TaxID=2916754 RepID=UPI001EE8AD2A|nr:hypothetical protein [Flaviramulus sp. BrNp1-15]ULC60846.1 hypothetical protein MBM09_07555 [Flaviramulus sp. BrNp1-15]